MHSRSLNCFIYGLVLFAFANNSVFASRTLAELVTLNRIRNCRRWCMVVNETSSDLGTAATSPEITPVGLATNAAIRDSVVIAFPAIISGASLWLLL